MGFLEGFDAVGEFLVVAFDFGGEVLERCRVGGDVVKGFDGFDEADSGFDVRCGGVDGRDEDAGSECGVDAAGEEGAVDAVEVPVRHCGDGGVVDAGAVIVVGRDVERSVVVGGVREWGAVQHRDFTDSRGFHPGDEGVGERLTRVLGDEQFTGEDGDVEVRSGEQSGMVAWAAVVERRDFRELVDGDVPGLFEVEGIDQEVRSGEAGESGVGDAGDDGVTRLGVVRDFEGRIPGCERLVWHTTRYRSEGLRG